MITFCVSISRPPSHRLSPTRRCFGFTLLHAAVRYQNTAALLLLLEHGAVDIRSRDKEGKTPFDYAVLSSDVGMIRAMLDCANAGKTKMPNLEVALKNAEAQLHSAQQSGVKEAEAQESNDVIVATMEEMERARRAEEEAAAAAEAEAARLLQEEIERAAKLAAEAAAAAAAKEAEDRRQQLEAEMQAQLEEEARLREEERRRLEAEEEEEEERRNARDARTQMLHFSSLVQSSLLKKGIGRDAPITVIRVRPLSATEYSDDPTSMLCDAEGNSFDNSDAPGEGRLAPGLATTERYALGSSQHGHRIFGCNVMQRDRDAVFGNDAVQYNDADQLNCYLEVGGTIIDSMTKGTNSTVIVCGARDAGKSYILGRPFHEHPFERDEYDEAKAKWTMGNLVRSDDSGLVERVGRDLMAYRTVLQAKEPSAKLFVVMSCFVIYQERMYDLLAKKRDSVLKSCESLKIVGQAVRNGSEGRGVFVQGLTSCGIAAEGPAGKRKEKKAANEKSVRGWLIKADANRRALAKDLKAGDKGLRRACCVTMFEILQLSEVKGTTHATKARRGHRSKQESDGADGADAQKQLLYASVSFVDLPGATREPSKDAVKKKEDVSITKMQASLSNCIEALARKQKQTELGPNKQEKKIIIPWRASKLTLLLRDKIGGQNLTLMIGAISPSSAELSSSRRTLEFLKICGELRQLSIEERAANVSVVQAAESDTQGKEAKKVEEAAARELEREERQAKRDRGETIYDNETGEELLDDDDLEDQDTGTSLASLLRDPDDMMEVMHGIGASSSVGSEEEDSHLQAHVAKRRAELQVLPEGDVVKTILDGFSSAIGFRHQLLDLDGQYLEQLHHLRDKDARQRQLLAELKSMLQVYLEFDIPDADEATKELRARLKLVLGAKSAGSRRRKSRGKFLSAFDDLSDKAEQAWTTAQLHLIKERCDMLVTLQVEIGSCRHQMIPLLQQQLDAIEAQRFRIFDEVQRARDVAARRLGARRPAAAAGWQALSVARRLAGGLAMADRRASTSTATADDDDVVDPLVLESQLHDLGLLTMHIEADKSVIETPPPLSDLFDPTLDYSKRFGNELHVEINHALDGLTTANRSPRTMISRLRVVASLVTRRAPAMDEVDALLNDETTQRRREALQHELSLVLSLIDPSVGPPLDPDVMLSAIENEMQRMAKALSDAIHARLLRMEQRVEDSRVLEARLERVVGPLDPELAAAEAEGHEGQVQVEDAAPELEEAAALEQEEAAALELEEAAALEQEEAATPEQEEGAQIQAVVQPHKKLAVGEWHTVHVRDSDGAVFSWGGGQCAGEGCRNLNFLGQGQSRGPSALPPAPVVGLRGVAVREVAAGTMHTLILGVDGRAWSCGVGRFGALGHGDQADHASPRQIGALSDVRTEQVAAGEHHSYALSADGHVYSFGWGADGRLGHGDCTTQLEPVRVLTLRNTRIHQVSAGALHSLAVDEAGKMYAWGCWANGRLGLGESVTENQLFPVPVPVELPVGVGIARASAGGTHSLAVATDSTVWSFGNGGCGQLGHGDEADRSEPTVVKALEGTPVRWAQAGPAHSLVRTGADEILAFGSSEWLCLEHEDNQLLPAAIEPLSSNRGSSAVMDVASGANHTVVLLADGELLAFGQNNSGQLGADGDADTRPRSISCAATVALPLVEFSGYP